MRLLLSASLALWTVGFSPSLVRLVAQDQDNAATAPPAAGRTAPSRAPATLPPVEVRPTTPTPLTPEGRSSADSEVSPSDTPPPNTPPSDATSDAPSDFGPSLTFPSLADQLLGGSPSDFAGLNGVSRGQQSLVDNSSFGSIIDQNSIREKQATDMFRALQNEPGVLLQSTGRGQAAPFIRGVTGQQVLILVDGVRLNNQTLRSGPNQYFNTIDPGQVERIEVVRGGGSVLWGGDAVGGVINIVTRSADPGAGDYGGGSFRSTYSTADSAWYGRANAEGWSGSGGVFAGASYLDVHNLDRGGGLGRQPFTDYDQYAGDMKFDYMLNERQMLTFALSHFEQQNLPRSDRFAPFVFNRPGNTPRPTFFDPQQRDLAYLRWQGFADDDGALFDTFSVTASYARTKEGTNELRSPTQLDVGEFTDDVFGVVLTMQKDLDAFGRFTYGGEFYHDDIDSSRLRTNPTNPNAAPTVRQPQYPNDAYADRVGAFVSWDVKLSDRWTATTGARFENVDLHATPQFTVGNVTQNIPFDRTYQEWVGSIGLNYLLNEEWRLVGGVYEGFRSPTIDDLTASTTFQQNAQQNPVLASLNVQPEHSYTYEIGMKYDGPRLRLQLFEWWMTIDDYITRNVDNVNNVLLGNHDAYLNGTELAGEYLLDGGWAAYGNFAYTYGVDRTDRTPYSRIPPTQGVVGMRWRDEGRRRYFDVYTWLVNRQDKYNPANLGDSRFWVGGAPATPGYGTLNLRCGTALGASQNHRVSLTLENITDQYYRVLGSGVDGAGFNALFGYEFLR